MQGLRLPQVISKLAIKKTKIYSLIKAGRFPRPIRIDGCSVWCEKSVNLAFEKFAAESIARDKSRGKKKSK